MKYFKLILIIFCGWATAQESDYNAVNSDNIFEFQETPTRISKPEGASRKSVDLIQYGNHNSAHIIDRSKATDLEILQVGNYNATYFDNKDHTQITKAAINIRGDDNYIDITGSNSISEGIKLNIQANERVIFLRNY